MKKKQTLDAISRVENYLLEKYGVEVYYGAGVDNSYYDCIKRIEIDSYQNYIYRLFSLLHEAGHVHVRNTAFQSFTKAFPHMKVAKRDERIDINHRIDVLREEVLAWKSAFELASTLGINLDIDKMSVHRNNCLKSYLEWV
jgi:hypothetical protein